MKEWHCHGTVMSDQNVMKTVVTFSKSDFVPMSRACRLCVDGTLTGAAPNEKSPGWGTPGLGTSRDNVAGFYVQGDNPV